MIQQKTKQFTPGLIPALLANNPGYKISSLGPISKEFLIVNLLLKAISFHNTEK
jgi:hypothetical protein